MDAILSGRASAIAFVEGDGCSLLRFGEKLPGTSISLGALRYVFSDAPDVLYLQRVSKAAAIEAFTERVSIDDAQRLALILLDPSELTEIREDAARELSNAIRDSGVREAVMNLFSSVPLPYLDRDHVLRLSEGFEEARIFIEQILAAQSTITRVRQAWDSISDNVFSDPSERSSFLSGAIETGSFRRLVRAVAQSSKEVNSAVLDLLLLLRDQPGHRSVISEWTKDFREKPRSVADEIRAVGLRESQGEKRRHHASPGFREPRAYEMYRNVLAQQDAIKDQLRVGNARLAQQFTNELIAKQVKGGDADLAAKSLCLLSQEANTVGQYSLQLEWAKEAVTLAPHDRVAHGHLADAYIFLHRFDEALATLSQVSSLGDERFAATNRARILRLQGRLDDALSAFEDLKSLYGDEEGNTFAWNGYAEVLRDMWRFPEALEAYELAIERNPEDRVAKCGKAAVLTELGRLAEAKTVYDQVIAAIPGDPVAVCGRANVLRHMDKLQDALAMYEAAAAQFPFDSMPVAGQAHVLRLMKNYEQSLLKVREGRKRFRYESVFVSESAEIYRDQGRFEEALQIYEQGLKSFAWDSRMFNGVALLNKELGNLEVALQIYDQCIQKFPYDLFSKSGRADVLKRLNRYDAALEAYEEMISRWPRYLGPRHSKAAVLTMLGRYDEAEQLLPKDDPHTLEEWIANHVRGMILLRQNKVDAAVAHFQAGLNRVPFAKERRYFQNALAIAYLKKDEFEKVSNLLGQPREPLANVLLLHAFAGSGQRQRASNLLQKVQSNASAQIIELSAEIARRFRIRNEPPKHDVDWIFRAEIDNMLLEAA